MGIADRKTTVLARLFFINNSSITNQKTTS